MKKTAKTTKQRDAKQQKLPSGWDEGWGGKVLSHYENQSEEEAAAEDDAAYAAEGQTVMIVPTDLVPQIRRLIAGRRGA